MLHRRNTLQMLEYLTLGTRTKNIIKNEQKVGMLLQKRTNTRGVGISNMRKSIYLLTATPTSHTHSFHLHPPPANHTHSSTHSHYPHPPPANHTHTFHPLSTIVIHTFNLARYFLFSLGVGLRLVGDPPGRNAPESIHCGDHLHETHSILYMHVSSPTNLVPLHPNICGCMLSP